MTFIQALRSGLSLTHKNAQLLLLQIILNAITIGLFYSFLRTTEGSILELTISIFLAAVTIFIFLLTQGGTFGVIVQESAIGSSFRSFFQYGIHNSWRFFLAVLPMALVGYALFRGYSYAVKEEESIPLTIAWLLTIPFKILWYIILPLMLVTLWLSVVKNGLAYSFKNGFKLIFVRALRLRSVLVYVVSFLIFAMLSYFLIMVKTPIKSPWLEFSALGMRLGFAYVLMIYGWTVMAGAIIALNKSA